jgi:hypothetical protein
MNKNIKVAKELVKLAKELTASDESDLSTVLFNMINNPKEGTLRYELPSGKWLTFDYDIEEDGVGCYYPAITSNYDVFNEPYGFWFFGAYECGEIYSDSSKQDCDDLAETIIDLDKKYRFDKTDKDKIIKFLKDEKYFDNYQMAIIEDTFDEFIDVVNENLETKKMSASLEYAFYDMENKYNNDDFDE